jgi:hypothetical protein
MNSPCRITLAFPSQCNSTYKILQLNALVFSFTLPYMSKFVYKLLKRIYHYKFRKYKTTSLILQHACIRKQ